MNSEKERRPLKVLRKYHRGTYGIVNGTENPSTLNCTFYIMEAGYVGTRFVPGKFHEGHGSMMHGGVIGAVLDELMGFSTGNVELPVEKPLVTAEMTVKYKRPIPTGIEVKGFARVVRQEGRRFYTEGHLEGADGKVLAMATGVFVAVDVAGDDKAGTYKPFAEEELDEKDPKIL